MATMYITTGRWGAGLPASLRAMVAVMGGRAHLGTPSVCPEKDVAPSNSVIPIP